MLSETLSRSVCMSSDQRLNGCSHLHSRRRWKCKARLGVDKFCATHEPPGAQTFEFFCHSKISLLEVARLRFRRDCFDGRPREIPACRKVSRRTCLASPSTCELRYGAQRDVKKSVDQNKRWGRPRPRHHRFVYTPFGLLCASGKGP
jgi:hypothetical protein